MIQLQHTRHQIKAGSGTELKLRDAQGRLWGSFDNRIDLQTIPSGAWMLEVRQGKQVQIYRFTNE